MKQAFLLALMSCLVCGLSYGEVLLDDTWTDATRTDTDLPNESAVWVSHKNGVTMGTGSLSFDQTSDGGGSSGSQKMWTYFAAEDDPVSIGVGQQLVTTIKFTPNGLYDSSSENFRLGLFNDSTDDQLLEDTNSDSGGGIWGDSTGYGVRFALSNGTTTADNPQIGKRDDMTNSSLLGSSGAYTWDSGGDDIYATDLVQHTITLTLDRTADDTMIITFEISNVLDGVLSTHSMTDTSGIYTEFEQLFFRFSNSEGTADVIEFEEIKVELIPEPATMVLLGLGGLIAARRKK